MGVQSIVNPNVTIYTSKKVEKEQHQLAIVGSLKPNQTTYENMQFEKELKQKNFADELKRQIEERDMIRKKEEWRRTRITNFT
jgi:4-hydroxy-3-methylbut-2-en-1-yl diphosphate synthase IspG/GcpE